MKRIQSILGNERGDVIILTLIIASVMAVTLSTLTVYTINQANYINRLRESYQMLSITEALARHASKPREMARMKLMQLGIDATTLDTNQQHAAYVASTDPNKANCDAVGSGTMTQIPAGTGKYYCLDGVTSFCVERPDVPGEQVCSSMEFGVLENSTLNIKFNIPLKEEPNLIEKSGEMIASMFDFGKLSSRGFSRDLIQADYSGVKMVAKLIDEKMTDAQMWNRAYAHSNGCGNYLTICSNEYEDVQNWTIYTNKEYDLKAPEVTGGSSSANQNSLDTIGQYLGVYRYMLDKSPSNSVLSAASYQDLYTLISSMLADENISDLFDPAEGILESALLCASEGKIAAYSGGSAWSTYYSSIATGSCYDIIGAVRQIIGAKVKEYADASSNPNDEFTSVGDDEIENNVANGVAVDSGIIADTSNNARPPLPPAPQPVTSTPSLVGVPNHVDNPIDLNAGDTVTTIDPVVNSGIIRGAVGAADAKLSAIKDNATGNCGFYISCVRVTAEAQDSGGNVLGREYMQNVFVE